MLAGECKLSQFLSDVTPWTRLLQWKMVLGPVHKNFVCNDPDQHVCIGSYQGGWGYVGSTGNKFRNTISFEPAKYGPSYGAGDVIGILLDFDKHTVSFTKNKTPLGVAYNDLEGPVFVAVALAAPGAQVSAIEDVVPAAQACCGTSFQSRPIVVLCRQR